MNEQLKTAAIAAMFKNAADQVLDPMNKIEPKQLLKEIEKGIDALDLVATE